MVTTQRRKTRMCINTQSGMGSFDLDVRKFEL